MTKTEAIWTLVCHSRAFLDMVGADDVSPEMRDKRKALNKAFKKIYPVAYRHMLALEDRRADKARVWRRESPDRLGKWRLRGDNFQASTMNITVLPDAKEGIITIELPGGGSLTVINPEWSFMGE